MEAGEVADGNNLLALKGGTGAGNASTTCQRGRNANRAVAARLHFSAARRMGWPVGGDAARGATG